MALSLKMYSAAGCYCFIRMVSCHETQHFTALCTNFTVQRSRKNLSFFLFSEVIYSIIVFCSCFKLFQYFGASSSSWFSNNCFTPSLLTSKGVLLFRETVTSITAESSVSLLSKSLPTIHSGCNFL